MLSKVVANHNIEFSFVDCRDLGLLEKSIKPGKTKVINYNDSLAKLYFECLTRFLLRNFIALGFSYFNSSFAHKTFFVHSVSFNDCYINVTLCSVEQDCLICYFKFFYLI